MNQKWKVLTNTRITWTLLSIVCMLCGSVFLFVPQISADLFCLTIGIILLIVGALLLALFFLKKGYRCPGCYLFSVGIFLIVFGLYTAINTGEVTQILTLLFQFAILFDSCMKIEFSFELLYHLQKSWRIVFVLGILTTVFAAIILINPFSSEASRSLFTYWILFIDGISNLVLLFFMKIISNKKS